MKSYFNFECNIDGAENARRDFCFLFKSVGTLRDGHLADAIEHAATSVLAPDGIAIVSMESEVSELLAAFKNEPRLIQAKSRLTNRISLYICCVNLEGNILVKHKVSNPSPTDRNLFQSNSQNIFQAGLKKLFSCHHVDVTAPAGFVFVKPSGDRSKRFLRTEDALTDVENVQFLSFALIRRLMERQKALETPIDVICIDTMAIASLAYTIRDMYCSLFNSPPPRVVSFHSHEGLANFDFPLFGTSFCIISASMSMRLERTWKEKSRCHNKEVVTLLTLENARDADKAVFVLAAGPRSTESLEGLRDIRMTGERFAPEDLKPKKVLIRKEAHSVKAAVEFSRKVNGQGSIVVQGKTSGISNKIRPLYIDGQRLLATTSFETFLQKVTLQRVPASICAIVCQDDLPSRAIANRCAELLRPNLSANNNLPVITHSELEIRRSSINSVHALLIVAAVVGRGSEIQSISRDLRPIHAGARTYLIGAQVAETQAQIKTLAANLKYSAAGSDIHVCPFVSVAIGESLSLSFSREHHVLSNFPLQNFENSISTRAQRVNGTAEGMSEDALLPSNAQLTENLKLRPDFAFWDFNYEEHHNKTPAVLLTVAAVLQQARESKELEEINRLGSDAFQQVVLDPENFARYNDGVIQGALLRAALPGELDYSSESDASRYMSDLISKIIIQHEKPQGEAALEFALAWKCGRLKLKQEDEKNFLSRVESALTSNTQITNLLRILLGFDQLADNAELPPEF